MICSFTLITAGGVKGTLRLLRIGLSMKASSCSSSSGPNSRLDGFILLENICSLEISQSVLVVSGRAGGGPQYQPSLMKSRGRRGWRRRRRRRRAGGGVPLSPPVPKEIPARSGGGGWGDVTPDSVQYSTNLKESSLIHE